MQFCVCVAFLKTHFTSYGGGVVAVVAVLCVY